MNDEQLIALIRATDPANESDVDGAEQRIRARVDGLIKRPTRPERPRWLLAAVSFALVLLALLPVLMTRPEPRVDLSAPIVMGSGMAATVDLTIGGIKTMAVAGDTIWLVESLNRSLHRINAPLATIEETYTLDRYVDGLTTGAGFVWLAGYENGGEVLRFNPDSGGVDLVIPLGGLPRSAAHWYGESLWLSTDEGEWLSIGVDGQILLRGGGELKGQALGYLWVQDRVTGTIESLAADGSRGAAVIDWDRPIRAVAEAGGYLWLMDDDFPIGTTVTRYDLEAQEFETEDVGPGLHGMVAFDGALWVVLHYDHTLVRLDPTDLQMTRYPLPGKPGEMVVANNQLWEVFFHPAALVRFDPDNLPTAGQDLLETSANPGHRLHCQVGLSTGPVVLLESFDWIGYGSWATIQSELNRQGATVCANGYLTPAHTPAERASDLALGLETLRMPGPFLLVANGDGVHALRLFAEGRSDVMGVVLVDPMPVGFQDDFAALVPPDASEGHPPWPDLDPNLSLTGLTDVPIIVLGHTPESIFLGSRFVDGVGQSVAQQVADTWQRGLEAYAALSSDSDLRLLESGGLEVIYWDAAPVVEAVLELGAP